jgi:hypothetical protein
VEMPGRWKAWKAKGRLPPLSTSPLENSPKAGELPTFPQRRRRGRMEKWKTKSRFSASHRPEDRLGKNQQKTKAGGLRPLPAKAYQTSRKETSPSNLDDPIFRLMPHWNRRVLSGSSPIGINSRFQAHLWIGKCS